MKASGDEKRKIISDEDQWIHKLGWFVFLLVLLLLFSLFSFNSSSFFTCSCRRSSPDSTTNPITSNRCLLMKTRRRSIDTARFSFIIPSRVIRQLKFLSAQIKAETIQSSKNRLDYYFISARVSWMLSHELCGVVFSECHWNVWQKRRHYANIHVQSVQTVLAKKLPQTSLEITINTLISQAFLSLSILNIR